MGGWVFAPFVGTKSSYRVFEVDTGGCWEPREQIELRCGAEWRNASQNWLQGPSQKGVTALNSGEICFSSIFKRTEEKLLYVLDSTAKAAWHLVNEVLMYWCCCVTAYYFVEEFPPDCPCCTGELNLLSFVQTSWCQICQSLSADTVSSAGSLK